MKNNIQELEQNKIESIKNENENNSVDYITKKDLKKTMTFVIIVVILFSAVLGSVFGFLTSSFFNNNNQYSTTGSKTVNLPVVNEQSAVISAVKKTNPSVVSIVISQKVPSNTNNLNNFFNFFNSGGSSGSGSSGSSGGKTQQVGAGSGFIISANGYILTNKHVVAASQDSYTVIMNNGKQYNAHVVSLDPTNDLAVVKINATNLPYLTLGNSSSLQLGQGVIAIGNALGQYQNTVDTGVVSGLARTVQAQDPATGAVETLNDVIQTDAEINPGNSGGPLLNLQGQVIGINTAVASTAHGIGFAIPINQAKADIQSVLKNGKIIKPELGVQYEPVTPGLQKTNHLKYSYGALIVKSSSHPGVVPNTPASRAGLKTGDIILEVNGQKVTSTDPLNYLIGKQQINTTITLQIYNKSGSIQNVSVTLNKVFK